MNGIATWTIQAIIILKGWDEGVSIYIKPTISIQSVFYLEIIICGRSVYSDDKLVHFHQEASYVIE